MAQPPAFIAGAADLGASPHAQGEVPDGSLTFAQPPALIAGATDLGASPHTRGEVPRMPEHSALPRKRRADDALGLSGAAAEGGATMVLGLSPSAAAAVAAPDVVVGLGTRVAALGAARALRMDTGWIVGPRPPLRLLSVCVCSVGGESLTGG